MLLCSLILVCSLTHSLMLFFSLLLQLSLMKEVRMMTALNHPNIVRFCGVCLNPQFIVTEYYHRGSLFIILQKARKQLERGINDKVGGQGRQGM
jgi:serine/threonine protein kinase